MTSKFTFNKQYLFISLDFVQTNTESTVTCSLGTHFEHREMHTYEISVFNTEITNSLIQIC